MKNFLKKLFRKKKSYILRYHINKFCQFNDNFECEEDVIRFYLSNEVFELADTIGIKIKSYYLNREFNDAIIKFYVYNDLNKDLFLKAMDKEFHNQIVIDMYGPTNRYDYWI